MKRRLPIYLFYIGILGLIGETRTETEYLWKCGYTDTYISCKTEISYLILLTKEVTLTLDECALHTHSTQSIYVYNCTHYEESAQNIMLISPTRISTTEERKYESELFTLQGYSLQFGELDGERNSLLMDNNVVIPSCLLGEANRFLHFPLNWQKSLVCRMELGDTGKLGKEKDYFCYTYDRFALSQYICVVNDLSEVDPTIIQQDQTPI